ncbi:MAG: FHA domain-containing protein [Rhodanobacter sp.]
MRIEFPHAAREDFHWAQASLRIGSAPGNDLVLAAAQAAPRHMRIDFDRRGWILQVVDDAGRVYVNARPVHERALLRAGDVVSVGDCRLLLCADDDPGRRPPLPASEERHCTVALRAVAGPLSGKVMALDSARLLDGRGDVTLDLPQGDSVTFHIGWRDGRLWLDLHHASARHPLRVNGTPMQAVALQPGDQIGVAMHRLVLEAPGMLSEPAIPAPPAVEPDDVQATSTSGGAWWLILTAVVLAMGIALALLIRR